jgi:hypothetical protein
MVMASVRGAEGSAEDISRGESTTTESMDRSSISGDVQEERRLGVARRGSQRYCFAHSGHGDGLGRSGDARPALREGRW